MSFFKSFTKFDFGSYKNPLLTHLFLGGWWAVEEVVWIGGHSFEILGHNLHEFILSNDANVKMSPCA